MEHQYICDSLELLGKTIIPEFKEREEQRAREKARRLEPVIEAAMKRKVEPQTPWYSEDYSYQSDGSTVTHFGFGPDTFANAERADNRPASQPVDSPAAP